jgi:hypothetical protein
MTADELAEKTGGDALLISAFVIIQFGTSC